MNLPAHILAKDLRRWWPLATFAAAFIILDTLGGLWGWIPDLDRFHLDNFIGAFAKWPVVFILVVAVMQEDRTVGDKAFWRTRPIGAGPLLLGKLLFFALALALPAVVANLTVATALDTSGLTTLGIAVETVGFTVLAVLAAALLAALTSTLLHAGLAALGGLFGVFVIALVRDWLAPYVRIRLPWDTDVPYPGMRVAVACALACGALVVLLAHQFFTRRTGRTVALLGVAIPLVLGTAVTWTFDFSRPSRAAAFPAKPLTQTENFTLTVETPARTYGTEWVWDPPARRNRPVRSVAAYADLEGTIPGRCFNVVEGRSTLLLRDGRELSFPSIAQYEWSWSYAQRESAVCRALGLEYATVRPEFGTQNMLRLFQLPAKQLAELGGAHGRLTLQLVLGETAFREYFRLRARVGAAYREPGRVWRIEEVTRTDEAPAVIILQHLRATTILAPRGDSRADIDPNPTDGRLFYLVNRKRGEYASSWGERDGMQLGIVTSNRIRVAFTTLRVGGRKAANTRLDAAWLADADLIVLHTEPVGKTEKSIVVEDFEVPRIE